MQFTERSFVDNSSYRPRPVVHFDPAENYIVVLTPWGQNYNNQDLLEKIHSYLTSFKMDSELTSPFKSVKHYDKVANAVRTSLLLANEYILKSKNQGELFCGYEIFIGALENNLFYFANIGHPHMLLHRDHQSIVPVGFDFDHAMNFSREKKLPPLPDKLLGVQESLDFQIQTMKVSNKDQLLLLSKSWIPKEFLSVKGKDRKFEQYMKLLSQDQNQPFWFGLLEF